MKRLFLLFFSFLSTLSYSQDYQNICSPGITFFKNDTGFFKAFRLDSIHLPGNGDTIFYSYRVIRPQMINECFDTSNGSLLGFKIYKKSNGTFYFFNKENDTITLLSQATLNQAWKFCNLPGGSKIEAKVTSLITDSVLGTPDAVKVITLQAKNNVGINISHFLNQKTIQISQHYGIFKSFDFYFVPDLEWNDTTIYILSGKTSTGVGYQNLTWKDIFNYDVGDEFHWYGIWSGGPTWKTMKRVLAKVQGANSDSVTYTMQYCKIMWVPQPPPNVITTFDTITEAYYFPQMDLDNAISGLPEELVRDTINGSPDAPYFNRIINFTGRYTQEFNYWNYAYSPTLNCWSYPFENGGNLVNYTEGLGVTYTHHVEVDYQVIMWWEWMEYYKKGDVTWGIPVASSCNVLVGQEDLAQPEKPEIQISPNPMETLARIFIKDYFNAGRLKYIIYDFLGTQIKKEEFLLNPFLFNRSGLNGGLYFIKVFDNDGLIGIKKILVK